MNFIEAVIAVSNHPNLKLCDDEKEFEGTASSICVYDKNDKFVGKIRWPGMNMESGPEKAVVDALKDYTTLK